MTKRYWRSLDALEQTPRYQQLLEREFPPAATEIELRNSEVSRRTFMGLMGAGTALAGLTLSGCVRKPQEQVLPFARRPEDLVPGRAQYFATAAAIAGGVEGLLVESHEGRPTKIEGNPLHPQSRGATSVWAQAEVLSLYDPARSRRPRQRGKPATWGRFFEAAAGVLGRLTADGGQGRGLCLLTEALPSPTYLGLIEALRRRYPAARLFRHDATFPAHRVEGAASLGVTGAQAVPRLDRAQVILSLDADFLGTQPGAVINAQRFASQRRVERPGDSMSRLYVVEPFFTVTGTMADHRLRLAGSQVGELLVELTAELMRQRGATPQVDGVAELAAALRARSARGKQRWKAWVGPVARDLLARRGEALILVGDRQPPWVHALAHLANERCGAVGQTLTFAEDAGLEIYRTMESLPTLAQALRAGQVRALIMIGVNPVYDAPADLGFGALLSRVPLSIHLGRYLDETGKRSSWHLPRSHFLEAWGDLRAADGTPSVVQPLIAPLFDTRSEIEILAHLTGAPTRRGYELVRRTWAVGRGGSDPGKSWRRWLHEGVIDGVAPRELRPAATWSALAAALAAAPPASPAPDRLELDYRLDSKLLDGRYAENAWLQELPDPITKLTWDNAACLGPATAARLGVEAMALVELSLGGKTLALPALIVPGTADDVIVLPLGYGRKDPEGTARGVGFDAGRLRTASAPSFAAGVKLRPLGRRHLLASTQDHGNMEGRAIIIEGDLERFRADPRFAQKAVKHPPLRSIWQEHEQHGQQWGISVDLNACTGCNACVLACQAENNISVVGKARVLEGREMHWLRIDRYFEGRPDDPRVLVQPMACQHCEQAPCEGVCPVAATVHSPEGLNDMAYNRCIGTRYCSNNCPYKVRRFNFFQYNKGIDPVARMQKNPDVTMRFRGVMEKCSYCVQRINEAKIDAKRAGSSAVADGAIRPACAQVCPTRAIVFGDVSDKQSEVARCKGSPRDYAVLVELNIKPRTTYLARLRNPNPELPGERDG